MKKFLFCLLLCVGIAHAQLAIPPLTARVTDLTATLTSEQQQSLEQTLSAFEARKGSQIAVLIVPTVKPESIEQYSIRAAEAWKLGRKKIDDGILFLIAKNDREMRIEVGYGLEGALPDITASRIIKETVTPFFKQGDFFGGINAGVDRIIRVVDGEPLPEPVAPRQSGGGGGDKSGFFLMAFVLIFVVGGVLRSLFGRFMGAAAASGIAGFAAWAMAGSIIMALLLGVVAFVITLIGGLGGGRFGGFGGGGFGGGGFGGGGGGGFGGGGGGFGGGGASGGW